MASQRSEQLEPLRVTAHLTGSVALRAPLMLDALLTWALSNREQSLGPLPGEPVTLWAIPVARDPSDRFYLCSQGHSSSEAEELRHKHRRPLFSQLSRLGQGSFRRLDTTVGCNKAYRSPYEVRLLADSKIEWWCVGYPERVRELLGMVRYLGRFRNAGHGKLDIHGTPWTVETCEPWDGFPVLRDGAPLRPLPLDYPGVTGGRQCYRTLEPPYWDLAREEMLACP